MEAVFLKLVNMSIAASWVVLAVIVLRSCFPKAPKAIRCVLWAMVGVRLVCPVSIQSVMSMIPSAETVSPDILYAQAPVIDSGVSAINRVINPVLSASFTPDPTASANPLQIWTFAASIVWVTGLTALLVYAAISYIRLRSRVRAAVALSADVWVGDEVKTPFILGIFQPRIYLPSDLDDAQVSAVLAHEYAHLRRRDHWWKPLGFLLLAIYWFQPLLWVAYLLLCRDIELACDERVVREMGLEDKKAYSRALLACSAPRRMISACPLAFGEVGIKQRVKSVLHYKKPAFWVVAAAVVTAAVMAVCFLTDPAPKPSDRWFQTEAWPLVKACAFQNGVAIEKGNASVFREQDGSAVKVAYPIAADRLGRSIVVLFEYAETDGKWGAAPERATVTMDSPLARTLTLEEVIALSQKGSELSWDDFAPYTYEVTGSGLYIRAYPVNELFSVWIGGGETTEPPMYIYLRTNTEPADRVDIRTEDISAFLEKHRDDLLEAALSAAILNQNGGGSAAPGEFPCESHVILATEAGGPATSGQTTVTTVYALVLFQTYTYYDGELATSRGSYIPAAVTFRVSAAGGYTPEEYWTPGDGSDYAKDIRGRFPGAAAQAALAAQDYIESLQKESDAKAAAYFVGTDINGEIAALLQTICAEPAAASAPNAYLEAHQTEYEALVRYGDYTLRYLFSEFLKGGQTGLRGHVMRAVLDDLIGGEALSADTKTGQEYFDLWYAQAKRLKTENGEEFLQKHAPKAWLLLQVAQQ